MRIVLIIGLILCVILFIVGCNSKSNSIKVTPKVTSELLGVSMYAEKNEYPSNVSEISVIWKNDTNKELIFGNEFNIRKLVGEEWKIIGKEAVFTTIGYIVYPNTEMKHNYNIRVRSDNLEKGTYRIITNFSDVHSPGNYDTYSLTTSFKVE